MEREAMKIAKSAKENSYLAFRPRAPHLTSIIPTEKWEAHFSGILKQDETEEAFPTDPSPMEGALEAVTPQKLLQP
jgi:hypothetical protein